METDENIIEKLKDLFAHKPEWVEDVLKHYNNLSSLEEDWGCQDEAEPSKKAIMKAFVLISELTKLFERDLFYPRVGPCRNGSIDVYWRGKNLDLLINIFDDKFFRVAGKTDGAFFLQQTSSKVESEESIKKKIIEFLNSLEIIEKL